MSAFALTDGQPQLVSSAIASSLSASATSSASQPPLWEDLAVRKIGSTELNTMPPPVLDPKVTIHSTA